jgi:hypothetical protein
MSDEKVVTAVSTDPRQMGKRLSVFVPEQEIQFVGMNAVRDAQDKIAEKLAEEVYEQIKDEAVTQLKRFVLARLKTPQTFRVYSPDSDT